MTVHAEYDRTFLPVPLEPRAWGWTCPACGSDNEVSDLIIHQRTDGAWEVDGPDRYLECSECGSGIAITPVWVQEVDPA